MRKPAKWQVVEQQEGIKGCIEMRNLQIQVCKMESIQLYSGDSPWNHFFRALLTSLMLLILTGCALEPRIVPHQFGFDALQDSPDIEVLNYQYGNSRLPSVRPPEWALRTGQVSQATNVNGAMLRGDFLYVKWRIKSSRQVFEDTVDLKSRLPANIKDDVIYFIIRGQQLYVYVITSQRRPNGWPPNGPRKYDFRKVITIYPDQPKL